MKKLGLIGGISWVSTIDYYRLINKGINEKLGDLNFAECIIYSFNYQDIKNNNDNGAWDKTLQMLSDAAMGMKGAGAEAIVLCANTMHKVADELEQKVQLPVIHIATVTADTIVTQGLTKVGLLGTKFTMEQPFFRDKLTDRGIDIVIPDDKDRDFIHYTIFEELGRNILKPETKSFYIDVINKLVARGAQGIILGCTEIPLLINNTDSDIPLFDTTVIHSKAAVEFALS
ncbi:aspartate/glutamate racemase family protein [Mucilaginibacter sp.]|jgi:aspartate racemase|uniref:aspartate/glutamate racemase family protein n=1 Tax=Mucilaginibacter sp. TaxID=1882438 RepID=UPI002C3F91C7|nr:aspartate/glutamate racemase family protein [Mucilaginibacter sp.]HTI61716.1 aspartate/glutamate racemase family protein [Mucilaginibacter sp.]